MKLFDLQFWMAAVGCMLLTMIIGGFIGYDYASDKAKVEEAGRTAIALAAQKKESDAVLDQERSLRNADRNAYEKFAKENQDAKAETDRTIACLRAGGCRLRAPVRTACEAATTADRPAASGSGKEGYAELTEDASVFLVGLLARGDEGIRKHAEVVDRYERLRLTCSTDPSTSPTTVGDPP